MEELNIKFIESTSTNSNEILIKDTNDDLIGNFEISKIGGSYIVNFIGLMPHYSQLKENIIKKIIEYFLIKKKEGIKFFTIKRPEIENIEVWKKVVEDLKTKGIIKSITYISNGPNQIVNPNERKNFLKNIIKKIKESYGENSINYIENKLYLIVFNNSYSSKEELIKKIQNFLKFDDIIEDLGIEINILENDINFQFWNKTDEYDRMILEKNDL